MSISPNPLPYATPPSPRPKDDDPASAIFGIIAAAIVIYWIITPLAYQALIGHPLFLGTKSTTQPAVMQPHDEVAITVAAPLMGLLALIVGNLLWRSQPFQRLGLTIKRLTSASWQGLIAVVLILPMMFGVVSLTQAFWNLIHYSHASEHDLLRILGDEPNALIRKTIIIAAVVLAPLAEEFFFRGMLQSAIKKLIQPATDRPPDRPIWRTRWLAIVIVSIIFAAIHGAIWMMPPLFFLSLCLGFAYEYTANLWVPILVHASFNATSVILFLASRH